MPARTPLYIDTPTGAADLPVFARDLRAQADHLQPGVVEANDLRVSVSGSTLTIQPGVVYIPDGLANPTLYRCEWTGAAATLAVPAPNATNARFDMVIARVRDMNVDGGTQRDWVLEVVQGTPVSTATLDNRQGAPDLPVRAVRLAEYVVPAGQPSLAADTIRDRRPRATGTNVLGRRISGNVPLPISGSGGLITEFSIETSGRPLRLDVFGTAQILGGNPASRFWLRAMVDDVAIGAVSTAQGYRSHWNPNADPGGTVEYGFSDSWFTPVLAAGRHKVSILGFGYLNATGVVIYANANDPLTVHARELPGAQVVDL